MQPDVLLPQIRRGGFPVPHLARAAGALSVVDNTFATPVLQQPIRRSAPISSSILPPSIWVVTETSSAGILGGPKSIVQQVRMHGLRYLTGATLSPLAAFLILRGLKTLEIRMARHTETADAIARFLEAHPAVAASTIRAYLRLQVTISRGGRWPMAAGWCPSSWSAASAPAWI